MCWELIDGQHFLPSSTAAMALAIATRTTRPGARRPWRSVRRSQLATQPLSLQSPIVNRLIPAPSPLWQRPLWSIARIGPCPGERKEATVILTLLVAVDAVLLAVLGQALLAPNDNIRPYLYLG